MLLIEPPRAPGRTVREVLEGASDILQRRARHHARGGPGAARRATDERSPARSDTCRKRAALTAVDDLRRVAPKVAIMLLAPARDQALARRAIDRGANDSVVTDQIDTRSLVQLIAMMFERRASDEQKFVERERAEVTLNSIGDAVMTTDTLGNVTYLNAEAEELTGWTRAEAFARPLAEVFDVTDGLTGQHARRSVAPGDRAQQEGPPEGQLRPGRPGWPRNGDRAFGRADSRSPGPHRSAR